MFKDSLKASFPVAFGYIPMGMAFGVLLQNLGLEWWWASVMGLFIFAGSAQFLAVTLLAAKVSLVDVFLATFFLNLRHVFYALALLDRYRRLGPYKAYTIFGLTDETFSLVSTTPHKGSHDPQFVFFLTALNQFWWVLGCTLGALLRTNVKFDSTGLEFSLTCLFVVLLLEQWLKNKAFFPLVLGAVSGAISLFLWGGQYFLLSSILMVLLGTLFMKDKNKDGII